MELGDVWGGDGDGTDPEQAGGGFDVFAFCRGSEATGPAMDGGVEGCSLCPSPGDLLSAPAALLVFCWAEGAQVWGREDSQLIWCNFYSNFSIPPASASAASLPLPLQNRQTFNSLSCLSATAEDGSQRLAGPQAWPAAPEVMPGRTPACTPVPEPAQARPDDRRASRDDLSCEEEEEGAGKEEDRAAWRSVGPGTESLFQLDGEIDIEQIENN